MSSDTGVKNDGATASLARSSAAMAAGTVVSRLLGVVRTTLQVAAIGSVTDVANAWENANTLPNVIFLLLAGGVLNAVLVPQITKATRHADGGREYVDRLLTLSITGLLGLTAVVTALAPVLTWAFGGTLRAPVLSLSIAFAFICLPQIFFYGLYTVLGQVLNARGQFAAYMWAPVAANIVTIAGLLAFMARFRHEAPVGAWTPSMTLLLAGSATLGVVAQGLVLIIPLWRSGFRYRPRWGFRGVGLRSASRVAVWTFAALVVSQAGFVVTSLVLGTVNRPYAGRGAYGQAFLVFMLPHSLVTVSLVTALFTRMSHAAHAGDLPEIRRDVRRGLRLTAVATVPATVGGILLGYYVTSTLYLLSGPDQTRPIAVVMMAMLAGLIPFGVLYLIQRVFYSFEDARTPFRLQVVVTAAAVLVSLLALLLPEQLIGITVGLGQSVSNLVGAAIGVVWVRRRLGGLRLGDVVNTYVRLGVAAVAAGVAAFAAQVGLGHVVHGRAQGPVVLLGAGAVFVVLYVLIAKRLRVQEVDELLGPVLGQARRVVSRRGRQPRMSAQESGPSAPTIDERRPTGAQVQGVGPGTVLGGRYAAHRRLSHRSDLEHWTAHDLTLERDVAVTVFSSRHPNAPAVLDSARRAAGIEDSRLVRILDVGTHGALSWVVEEPLTGSESLAGLLTQGPLPPEEARRIVGEAASGLEQARQRGLHHLRLTPHAIRRAVDGSIKVSGLAIAASLDGIEEPDSAVASRTDAVALVAVAYAALTSRWPLDGQAGGVEPAPRVVGGVASPSEIAAGVPGDLDAICRLTLNEDLGPLTPGDLASQISPWSRSQVGGGSGVEPTVALTMPLPPQLPNHPVPPFPPTQVPGAENRSVDTSHGASSTGATSTGASSTSTASTDGSTTPGGTDGVSASRSVGSALAGAGAAAGAAAGRFGSFARAAADKASARGGSAEDGHQRHQRHQGHEERPARPGRPPRAERHRDDDGPRMTLPEAFAFRQEPAEPPLPMLGPATAQPPTREQSKLVLVVVAAFVVLALLVGVFWFPSFSLGSLTDNPNPRTTPSASAPPATPSSTPSSTPDASDTSAPIVITSARGFDPDGDGKENNSQAPHVYDGRTGTVWTTEGYSTAELGGLKPGVGLLLDLGKLTQVHKVSIELAGGPVDFTVYAAARDSLQGATPIGSESAADGTVDLTAPSDLPKTQYVIVWFTKLAPDGGRFRAKVTEIRLS